MREFFISLIFGGTNLFCSGCQSTKYSLFSVVNHRGSIDAGHYMAYIRLHTDEWYICNDDNILKVSLSEVLRSEG